MSQSKKSSKKEIDNLSRSLSKLLRHKIDHYKLTDVLRPDGYVPLSRVLSLPMFTTKHTTVVQIEQTVHTNSKQRFSLSTFDDVLHIRANQGHSIAGLSDELMLNPITITDASTTNLIAVHGTNEKNWMQIQNSGGLKKMGRKHVHLAEGYSSDKGVISGMRSTSTVIIYVDVQKAIHAGLQFFRSENGVILSPGVGEHGLISSLFFHHVVHIGA
ncbi:hypothetical protein ScalyP_jg7302 [Parmales sp. scaly parma]|nr:hypothetical protein ScalyP_jg7302 [Parmales sp. scaly parma]